jgi:hypothetical protein
LGGLHPLCGIGVRSLILVIARPAVCRDRIATSRPAPGPFIYTSTWRNPCSMALRAAVSEALCAANAVPLRDPLKPTVPALPHHITLPCRSVRDISVLLNVALINALPDGTDFLSRLLPLCGLRLVVMISPYRLVPALLRPATVFRLPRFVRAFVLVR